jgi:hypothetical protein
MINKKDLLFKLIRDTRDGSLTWYKQTLHSKQVVYISEYRITERKRLFLRFNHSNDTWDHYLSIKFMNKNLSFPITRIINNYNYASDMDALYYTIKYTKPKYFNGYNIKVDY